MTDGTPTPTPYGTPTPSVTEETPFVPPGRPIQGKPGQHRVNLYGPQFKEENTDAAHEMDEKITKLVSNDKPTYVHIDRVKEAYEEILEAVKSEQNARKHVCCLPARSQEFALKEDRMFQPLVGMEHSLKKCVEYFRGNKLMTGRTFLAEMNMDPVVMGLKGALDEREDKIINENSINVDLVATREKSNEPKVTQPVYNGPKKVDAKKPIMGGLFEAYHGKEA